MDDAIAAGYAQFQGCVSGAEKGAMGVHFANGTLFDDRVDVEHPEVLVYEPRNGKLHLVAVEYIAPAPAWEATHQDYDKPELMGQLFSLRARLPNRATAGGSSVLRAARVGLEGEPARSVRRLESERILRAVGWCAKLIGSEAAGRADGSSLRLTDRPRPAPTRPLTD